MSSCWGSPFLSISFVHLLPRQKTNQPGTRISISAILMENSHRPDAWYTYVYKVVMVIVLSETEEVARNPFLEPGTRTQITNITRGIENMEQTWHMSS